MTSMEQINYIAAEARKRGMKYGEYVKQYGHTLPKPEKRGWKEIPFFEDVKEGRPRDKVECICIRCGSKFLAGSRKAQYCPECTDELKRIRAHEQYLKRKAKKPPKPVQPKKEEVPQEKIVYCAVCGVKMIVKNRNQKYCDICRVDRWNEYQRARKREKRKKEALSNV